MKLAKIFTAICVTFTAVVCICQYVWYAKPHEISLSNYGEAQNVAYKIETLKEKNCNYDTFKGWIVSKGNAPVQYNTRLVLYTDGSDRAYAFPLKYSPRTDVTDEIDDGNDYESSGFEGMISHKYSGKGYKIGILFDVGRKAYLYKTDLYYTAEEGKDS